MKKPDIARQMAKRGRVSEAEAADRLDAVVHEILSSLKNGDETPFPGLGMFLSKAGGKVAFRKSGGKRRG
jgi:nucleoid DNA-binding protein